MPEKMPGHYYAFLLWGLIGLPLSLFVWGFAALKLPEIATVVFAKSEFGAPSTGELRAHSGKLYHAGERYSALGTPAAAWYGRLELRVSSGKSTHTTTWCNLGATEDVRLQYNDAGLPMVLPNPAQVSFTDNRLLSNPFFTSRPTVVFTAGAEVSPPPKEIFARCAISRQDEQRSGRWIYSEASIPSNADVVFYGCALGQQLVACPYGHLSAGSEHSFEYSALRNFLLTVAGLIIIVNFFVGVAGVMAYRQARAASVLTK